MSIVPQDDKPETERYNPHDPSSQPAWSAKPVASVSPLPAVKATVTSSSDGRNGDSVSTSPATQSPAPPPEGFEWAVALYDFEAQRDDELGFVAGEKLLVDSRFDQDWLYGCTVKGDTDIVERSVLQLQLAVLRGCGTSYFLSQEHLTSQGRLVIYGIRLYI